MQAGHRLTGPATVLVERDDGDDIELDSQGHRYCSGFKPQHSTAFRNIMDRVWISDEVFELEELPESLAVIGTGALGLELGQAFSRLGVKVSFSIDTAIDHCVIQRCSDVHSRFSRTALLRMRWPGIWAWISGSTSQ
ncbi:MAG: FAD-dependent oxidoreductase [Gammaproteobacteria bacterium]